MHRPLFRKLSLLVFALFVWIPGSALAQDTDDRPTDVKLLVQTSDGRTQFQMGEIITLKLSFASSANKKYQINTGSNDRRGHLEHERFQIDSQEGWIDPWHLYFSGVYIITGGLGARQVSPLTTAVILSDLNESVRFDKPGKYSLRVISNRVTDVSNNDSSGVKSVELTSNELQITITPATRSWQDETLKAAVATLDRPAQPNPAKITSAEIEEFEKAGKTLRYLGTPDSVKEMARKLASDDNRIESQFFFGLTGTSNPKDTITELRRLMSDPDYAVTQSFFFALDTLQRNADTPPEAISQEIIRNREIIMEELRPAVSRKRGKALATTLTTILGMTNRPPLKSEHISDAMVAQIISIFDQLPIEKQAEILSSRWDLIEGAFLPILRKYALAYTDFPVPNVTPAYYSLQLSGSALMRWYELEPDEARKAIIQEIHRPKLRYGARVLGVLPDETLPEVEQALAAHFATAQDLYGWLNPASLINRYAGDSILPQVLPVVDKQVGKWSCEIEQPILAYLLRVDPATARPRFEAAIAARGPGYSDCNRTLFMGVGALYQDALLEELAIGALDDSDPEVAGNATKYLSSYGSAAAEGKLWENLTRWSERWNGRERDVSVPTLATFTESSPDELDFALGRTLIEAIISAKSWVVDENKLRRLRQLAVLPSLQHEMEDLLPLWEKKTWSLRYQRFSDGKQFQVLSYEADSINAIEEKLLQFPTGSTFMWIGPVGDAGDADRVVVKELSEFLSSHGMKLTIPAN